MTPRTQTLPYARPPTLVSQWAQRWQEWTAALRAAGPELARFIVLTAATVVAFSLIFPPRPWWPLAFVCLTPWTIAVCQTHRAWIVHWGSFLAGWAFFLVNLHWLMPVTGLGYVALGFYLALYWPMAAWAIRTGRRAGISPAWTLPVVWVACEYLRAWVMTGFPWLFVAHAFYEQLAFIQISDLTGAYGVTFLAAFVNGVLAEWLLRWLHASERMRPTQPIVATLALAVALLGNLAYGRWRLQQADFADGPLVAVVQEDFPLFNRSPYGEHLFVVFAKYFALAAQAAAQQPDLLVLPETVWGATQNIGFLEVDRQAVDDVEAVAFEWGKHAQRATAALARGDYREVNAVLSHLEGRMDPRPLEKLPGRRLPRLPASGGPPVALVVGSTSIDVYLERAYPRHKKFNSALVYDADGVQRRERYDKMHLVPFGEFVPFRSARFLGLDLHWLYRLLNDLSPFSQGGRVEYSLWPGERYTAFELALPGRTYRFGTPICYEDVTPYLIRKYVWESGNRRVDFLLNISNDGWFQHSAELPQHLAICAFRAVENRIGIARAVNTGISGFIDPSGRLYSLVEKDGRTQGPGVVGYRVAPIKIDARTSWYGKIGDAFAAACLTLATTLWLGAIATRWLYSLQQHLFRRRSAGAA